MDNLHPENLKGHFLIAMPGLTDPNFSYTVTCICEHNDEGAVGIVVNRVHPSLFVKDIFEELNITGLSSKSNDPLYIGGPVHLEKVFILHGQPFDWEGCIQINPTLAMSNTRDIIEAMAKGAGPESIVIAIGCAGWGPGQLEWEIKQNAWLTSPVKLDVIFEVSIENRWKEAMKQVGIDPTLLSATAGHA